MEGGAPRGIYNTDQISVTASVCSLLLPFVNAWERKLIIHLVWVHLSTTRSLTIEELRLCLLPTCCSFCTGRLWKHPGALQKCKVRIFAYCSFIVWILASIWLAFKSCKLLQFARERTVTHTSKRTPFWYGIKGKVIGPTPTEINGKTCFRESKIRTEKQTTLLI